MLALLGTDSDSPRAWICANDALQRVLLTARVHGLQAGYLDQPIQVARLRARLQTFAGGGYAQILLPWAIPRLTCRPRRDDG